MNLAHTRILIVEDDDLLRECIIEIFEIVGAQVRGVPSGDEALRVTAQDSFDVIITDLRMPGLDGAEFIRQLRSSDRPQPIVFVCTGNSDVSIDDFKGLDVIGVFGKPFDCDEILHSVREAVAKAS